MNVRKGWKLWSSATLLFVALATIISIIPSSVANASIFDDWAFNGDVSEGYFSNAGGWDQDYAHRRACGYSRGCPVLPNGDYAYEAINGAFRDGNNSNAQSIQRARDFVAQMKAYYNSGDGWAMAGSAFIANIMMGYGSDNPNKSRSVSNAVWAEIELRLVDRASKGRINWNVDFSSNGQDTYSRILTNTDGVQRWDIVYDGTWNTRNGIIVYNDNGTEAFKLWYACANPVGSMGGLPIASYNLKPTVTASPATAEANTNVTASPTITNDGPANSTNSQWQLTTFNLGSAGAIPVGGDNNRLPTVQYGNGAVVIASGTGNFVVGPNALTVVVRTVGNLTVGSRICFALSVQPYNQTTTDWRHGTPFCVTVAKKPKVQIWGGDLQAGATLTGQSPTIGDISTSVTQQAGVTNTFAAPASDFSGLWRTGVDGGGNKLAANVADPHWTLQSITNSFRPKLNTCQTGTFPRQATSVVEAGGRAGLMPDNVTRPWARTVSNARWIGQNQEGRNDSTVSCPDPTFSSANVNRANIYDFKLTNGFTVANEVDLDTLKIQLTGIVDNEIQFVVNGKSLGAYQNPGFGNGSQSLTVTSNSSNTAFKHGANSLDILVRSTYANTGILIDSLSIQGTATTTTASTYGSWSEYGASASGTVKGIGTGSAFKGGLLSYNVCNVSQLVFTSAGTSSCSVATALGGYSSTQTMPNVAAAFPISASTPTFNNLGDSSLRRTETGVGTITIGGGTIQKGDWLVINAPTATVNITGDIRYTNAALSSVNDIPQLVIIASCINIAGGVQNVDAWLVATGSTTCAGVTGGGVLNTCSDVAAGGNLSSAVCSNPLRVNGPVMAKHLYMQRTAGAGPDTAAGDPAEVFNLRPDAYLWMATRSIASGYVQSSSTTELPPRF